MELFEPINQYCERTDAAFWSEPINAITNAAFLIAAAIVWWKLRQRGDEDYVVKGLTILVALIGVGSFLFHTFANGWSLLADVIPITIFIFAYFFLACRRYLRLGLIVTILATIAFFFLSTLVTDWTQPLIGESSGYVPGLIVMFGFVLILWNRSPAISRRLLAAGVVFTVSLTFRTIDPAICGGFPLGTHFLWHCLNAVTLYMLLTTAMLERGRYGGPAAA